MRTNARFEQKIRDNIIKPHGRQQILPGYGIILGYDRDRNVATVMMSAQDSDAPGEIYHNVPCPTHQGVQHVDPEEGRQAWVAFKNSDASFPVITHFYNYFYEQRDRGSQNYAETPFPRFILGL